MVALDWEAVMVRAINRLADELYFLEDQLELERHSETARFGPLSPEEEAKLKEFNLGYKKCLCNLIRCMPGPFGYYFMEKFKELYDGKA